MLTRPGNSALGMLFPVLRLIIDCGSPDGVSKAGRSLLARSTAFSKYMPLPEERWYAESRPPSTRMVVYQIIIVKFESLVNRDRERRESPQTC